MRVVGGFFSASLYGKTVFSAAFFRRLMTQCGAEIAAQYPTKPPSRWLFSWSMGHAYCHSDLPNHWYFRRRHPDRKMRQVRLIRASQDPSERHRRTREQLWGQCSKQNLSDLCFQVLAQITPKSKDRYGRTIANVRCSTYRSTPILSRGHVINRTSLIADCYSQGGNCGIQLVGQVARDDLQRFLRRLLDPAQRAVPKQHQAKAVSDFHAIVLLLLQGRCALGAVSGVVLNTALSAMNTSLERVTVDALVGQLDRSSGCSIELDNILSQGFNRCALEVLVEYLHIGQSHR